jgi:hypothetical protein
MYPCLFHAPKIGPLRATFGISSVEILLRPFLFVLVLSMVNYLLNYFRHPNLD